MAISLRLLNEIDEWTEDNPLRRWRLASDPIVSVRIVAILLKVSIQSIYLWERGERKPDPKNIDGLKSLTGICTLDVDWEYWSKHRPTI